LVRAGSVVSFPKFDDVIVVRVLGIAERRGPFVEACQLYADLTRGRTVPDDDASALTGALVPV